MGPGALFVTDAQDRAICSVVDGSRPGLTEVGISDVHVEGCVVGQHLLDPGVGGRDRLSVLRGGVAGNAARSSRSRSRSCCGCRGLDRAQWKLTGRRAMSLPSPWRRPWWRSLCASHVGH